MKPQIAILCALLMAACTGDSSLTSSEASPPTASPKAVDAAATGTSDTGAPPTAAMLNGTAQAQKASSTSVWDLLRVDPRREIGGLDPSRNHRLVGDRGEVILIPANSLQRPDGSLATGPIQVTWAFAAEPMDFVMMRAPTVSDNALLGSGGSFFLEASESGTPLRIADGGDWTVRMPADPVTLFPKEGMRYFKGVRGANNDVEWSIVPDQRIEVEPITYKYFAIPQDEIPGRSTFARIDSLARLYPERNNMVQAPGPELAMGRDRAEIARKVLAFHDDPRYAGTYVCSLPFAERISLLTKGVFGQVRSSGGTHWIDERGANAHILEALDIYARHAGEELFIPDAIVKAKLERLDVIIGTTPGVTGIHINELRTAYATYAEQHLAWPLVIDDRGLDLDRPDAFDALMASGLSLREADAVLADHADRKASLGGVSRAVPDTDDAGTTIDPGRIRLKDGRLAVVKTRTVNTLRFSCFGYVNCDRFLRQDISSPVSVFVTLDKAPMDNEDVQLLIPSINGCITLQRDPSMHAYRLPPRFFGLPFGLAAHVLVIGERDGTINYDLQKVTVDSQMNLRLSPRPGTMNDLCDRVKLASKDG